MQGQNQDTSFRDKINLALFLAELPALTVMVFLRKRIGYRTLSPWRFVVVMVVLLLLGNPFAENAFRLSDASVDPSADAPAELQAYLAESQQYAPLPLRPSAARQSANSGYLGVFGMLALVFAAAQRTARWKDIQKGVRWHTYHRGISHFSFWRFRNGRAERWIDPAVSILLGLILWRFLSPALGAWLVLSGLALRFMEFAIYKRNLEYNLDILDASVDGQTVDEVVQHFEQHPTSRTFSSENVEVIHTRLAPDVEALIARRKKRKQSPSNNNGESV